MTQAMNNDLSELARLVPIPTGRHKARELTLQALYQSDITGEDVQYAVEQLCEENHGGHVDLDYFQKIASGTWKRIEELDQMISRVADNWSVQRIATIDRNVLRQAVFELLTEPGLDVGVIINEAVILSKRYGDKKSGAFVNGVLDRLAREIRTRVDSPSR
ncbi:MAG: transcription antitermination factor NusB [Magnetococcales bacterium]|nr:transcription antitermination factor NusB [Magnetococcales bacterium]MBF0149762.1 transcription antitermination factor NusB [Magnetococcales bacterium]MBF0173596.1 transcription antitermination factor NusB [Magnetococcales bacterium]MBF0347023.1 transcription antitermination factor NusB [Magnetococcales bacterium]MBF0632038.1 transcription antitermination factor NusB [Magnetococcales bacterium]